MGEGNGTSGQSGMRWTYFAGAGVVALAVGVGGFFLGRSTAPTPSPSVIIKRVSAPPTTIPITTTTTTTAAPPTTTTTVPPTTPTSTAAATAVVPNAVLPGGSGAWINALRQAGFGYAITYTPVSGCPHGGMVLSQAPSAGSVAAVGSTVTLSVESC